MSVEYIEIHFQIDPRIPGSDILVALLAEENYESFVDTSDGVQAYIQQEYFDRDRLEKIIAELSDIQVNFTETKIPPQNWNEVWESNFSPIQVNDECCIRAPFHPASGAPLEIIIEPKMSFGTGHHETTWLMIETMLGLDLKAKNVLDMGCGTGVLAIVADKKEAAEVLAIDIDRWSYENTLENIIVNGCSHIKVEKGDARLLQNQQFDVILANINKNILINDLPAYAACLPKGGHILLSGFFQTDKELIISKASEFSLQLFGEKTKNKWCLLQFIKN